MNVLILEDEIPAQFQLKKLLKECYPNFIISATLDSLTSASEWLKVNNVDLILMDVELSDGICFELFNMVKINSCVIITTAYESYALNAFKVNSIDYLLKPIDKEKFRNAVDKCLKLKGNKILDEVTINKLYSISKAYKQRFAVKQGTQIIIIDTNEIAYFYSENKNTFLVTYDKKRYLSDLSLEAIENQINPDMFFKISRSCIAGINSIESISKHFNSRLKVRLKPSHNEDFLVSRVKVPQFINWLEGVLI